MAVIFAFIAALGFGSGTIFIRLSSQGLPAAASTFFGVSVGVLMALSVALVFNARDIAGLSITALGWLVLLGALAYPLGRLLIYSCIPMIGASRTAPITSASPVWAALMAIAFLGERPNLLLGIGTLAMVCGIALVVSQRVDAGSSHPEAVHNKLGFVLAVGAGIAFGGVNVVGKHLVGGLAPPLVTSAFALLFGFLMLGCLSFRQVYHSLHQATGRHIVLSVMAGVCQSMGSIFLYQALDRAPVTVVSPIYASSPLVTLALAHIFLHRLENLGIAVSAGTIISVVGVTVVIIGA